MKHKGRLVVLSLLLVMVALSVAGSEPNYGGTIVVSHLDPTVWNPVLEFAVRVSMPFVFRGVIDLDTSGRAIPYIAKSWEIAQDGLTYTFHLRDDVLWSDGVRLTSADVKFTYGLILDPEVGSPFAQDFSGIKNIETPDDDTVIIHLEECDASFLPRLVQGLMPKHIWENEDLRDSDYNSNPVGNGPWILKEWVPLDYTELVANELFFKGRPYLDKVILKVAPDSTVAFAALERGELHYFPFGSIVGGIPYEQLGLLKENPSLTVNVFESISHQDLYFRVDEPPFDKVAVRRAVAHAIDRDFIVEKLLAGYGSVNDSCVVRAMGWAYNPDVRKYAYDPQEAERLLDSAGYPRGADGVRFETTISGTPGTRQILSEIIKQYLAEVGIEAQIAINDWTTYINQIRAQRTHHGMWSVIATPHIPDPDDGTQYLAPWQIMPGGINPSFYNNPEAGRLVREGKAETDPEERRRIYFEYQDIIASDVPVLPLYTSTAVDVWNHELFEGFYSNPWGNGSLICLDTVWKK